MLAKRRMQARECQARELQMQTARGWKELGASVRQKSRWAGDSEKDSDELRKDHVGSSGPWERDWILF